MLYNISFVTVTHKLVSYVLLFSLSSKLFFNLSLNFSFLARLVNNVYQELILDLNLQIICNSEYILVYATI